MLSRATGGRERKMTKGRLLAAGWLILFMLGAIVLPPTDSHQSPRLLLAISFVVAFSVLSASTLIAMLSYLIRSWRRVGLVPNRVSYSVWLGFETTLFLVVLGWILWAMALAVAHR
jgi:hypothetical protein